MIDHTLQTLLAAVLGAAGMGVHAAQPANLRCEYMKNPLGVDVAQPALSWEITAEPDERGVRQTAYHIRAASLAEKLAKGEADLWDSGKVVSDETLGIEYAGKPLASQDRCFWKVKVWDGAGKESEWSRPAMFSVGLLKPEDWRGRWIADRVAAERKIELPRYGWLCVPAQSAEVPPEEPGIANSKKATEHGADEPVWVEIDLGKPQAVDSIVFFPARDLEQFPDEPSHVFPLRFRIKASSGPDGADWKIIVDRTGADEPDPGRKPRTYEFPSEEARTLRVEFTRLRPIRMDYHGAALAEIEVRASGKNVARGSSVRASRTLKGAQWNPGYLVDGVTEPMAGNFREFKPVMMRREFAVKPGLRRATLYATARGIYEFSLNGRPAGDGRVLAPEWTDYAHRIQYQAHEVTALLKEGPNAAGVVLSPGWYSGHIGHSPPFHRYTSGNFPQFLAQIEIEYADGTRETAATGEGWQSSDGGPYVYSDFIDGQVYDARNEMPGWDTAGFPAVGWRPVVVDPPDTGWVQWNARTGEKVIRTREEARPRLVAQMSEPVRVMADVKPVAMTEPRPGVHVFDLGQNIAGWCRLNLRAPKGATVRLRHAEVLQPDGMVYVSNLRTARAIDTYIARGGGEETFEPRMTQHGFRYVEVTGLPRKPRPDDLTGRVVRSSAAETGRFESSDPLLNRIMEAMCRTLQGNMLSAPSDCPQRDERMGWTGDGQFAAPAAMYFMDAAGFYRKWVADIRDGQFEDGRFPQLAPVVHWEGFGPGWSDAGVTVPWLLHVNYGDRRTVEENYASARRWVDFVQAANPDGIYRNKRGGDWGDWLNGDTLILPGWKTGGASVPQELWATAIWARSTEIVAKMAVALGDPAADAYRERYGRIKASFQKEFLSPDGRLTGDTQAGYALALCYGLIDPPVREKTARWLGGSVRSRDFHPTTGITAVLPLFEALSQNGLHDEACRMMALRTPPSFGYMIEQGGTTIWERWDGYIKGRGFGHPKMNSFNHPALAGVAAWVWRHLAGIQSDEAHPGYNHFFIAPKPPQGLEWVKASYDSVRGPIGVEWKRDGQRILLECVIPPNTTATVTLPNGEMHRVESGSYGFTSQQKTKP